jgi:hypothetical protein
MPSQYAGRAAAMMKAPRGAYGMGDLADAVRVMEPSYNSRM